jgi:predicted nucleic acid-binding protein
MAYRYGFNNLSTLPLRPVFFDANILLYIFWPTGTPKWVSEYSTIFNRLIKQKNEMAVDVTVISEVINRSIRIEYDKYIAEKRIKKEDFPFKKYRDSQEGKDAITDIYSILNKKILPLFRVLGKAYTKSDIEGFLSADNLDFSDKLIVSLCKDNNCILMTNDRDYATSDIDILSSNPVLVRS